MIDTVHASGFDAICVSLISIGEGDDELQNFADI